MKKYLMFGLAALAFASCSKNDLTTYTPEEIVKAEYDAKFIAEFGNPNPNHDWGFGASTRAFTRTISAKNGDAYDVFPSAADVAAYFPTAIPDGADEVSGLLDKYYGKTVSTQYGDQTLWGIYQIYQFKIVEGYNLKVTNDGTYENNVVELGGNYQNAGWDGEAQMNVAYPYNVYVNVDGDLTIRRVGATHFNLYILKGNVTLESNYGEQAGLISVAAGATLNDQRNSIAANQGVSIYNRGTINATNTEKYDIGNFCKVYNESKFNVTGALTYSPGDANNSYFVNLGDGAELTAPSMTLNSTGNFFNSGKAKITGETKCTQARLYWVNDGFYETGTMTFSAKNTTFYNYCQLIVKGNAHMYDGEFNLMTNSYTEAGTAEFDNFFINMYGSTGMYVKGNVKLEAQGDGTFQGFKNKDNAANKYWLVDGKVTIASHKQTLSIESGITYSINEMEIIKGGNVVTEEYLQSIGDGDYPVTVLEGTECPYGKLTVTPNTNSCGATWTVQGTTPDPTYDGRIMAEDLTVAESTDWDFNDVVFDYKIENGVAHILLQAAGGTLPLTIGGSLVSENEVKLDASGNPENAVEVHDKFGVSRSTMVNTGVGQTKEAVAFDLTDKTYSGPADIVLCVQKNVNGSKQWIVIPARKGDPAGKFVAEKNTPWCDEYANIKKAWGNFASYVQSGSGKFVGQTKNDLYFDRTLRNEPKAE